MSTGADESGFSGRKVIGLGLLVIVLIMVGLFALYRSDRAAYQRLAAEATAELQPLVARLLAKPPPDVAAEDWEQVRGDSAELVRRVASLNMLDRRGLDRLRAELKSRADSVTAATARGEAAALWADLLTYAGPRIPAASTGRIEGLPPPTSIRAAVLDAMKINRFLALSPGDAPPEDWAAEVGRVRGDLARKHVIMTEAQIADVLERTARATPEDARGRLRQIESEGKKKD